MYFSRLFSLAIICILTLGLSACASKKSTYASKAKWTDLKGNSAPAEKVEVATKKCNFSPRMKSAVTQLVSAFQMSRYNKKMGEDMINKAQQKIIDIKNCMKAEGYKLEPKKKK